ncbi:hypothetical protein [Ruegeria sp.]|uniref:hypothetical protein n=1 Tax=Ruegeria sp. TaxID=1879320 RepID=UPI00230E7923|nr:hypothetical protein [Ruegeria sp.]MDA7963910.1 hypothetical protein [Ruegeria sp.]
MRTGNNGRRAITWTQTELDGLEAAPLTQLVVGASWSWRGRAVALDGADAVGLDQTLFAGAISLLSDRLSAPAVEQPRIAGQWIEISNGAHRFVADLIWVDGEEMPVLVFESGCPERDQDFWICAMSDLSDAEDHGQSADDVVVAFPAQRPNAERQADDLGPLILTAAE